MVLDSGAAEELDRLARPINTRMQKVIQRLGRWPQVSRAKPLRHERKGHYRVRTGDYRLQFRIEGEQAFSSGSATATVFTKAEPMTPTHTLNIEGKRFVLIEEAEYERLHREAGYAVPEDDLPTLPQPDKHGRVPALEYSRLSLARSLIRDRVAAGLSQQRLADLAGVRQETISRLESGKHTASVPTIEKIDHAIEAASKARKAHAKPSKGR